MFRVSVIFDDGSFTTSIVNESSKIDMFRRFADTNNDKYTIKWDTSDEIMALDGDAFVMSIQAIPFE